MSTLGWIRSLTKHVDTNDEQQQQQQQQQHSPQTPRGTRHEKSSQQQQLSQQEQGQSTLPPIQQTQNQSLWLSSFRSGKSNENEVKDDGNVGGDGSKSSARGGGKPHNASTSPANGSPAIGKSAHNHASHGSSHSKTSNASNVHSGTSAGSIILSSVGDSHTQQSQHHGGSTNTPRRAQGLAHHKHDHSAGSHPQKNTSGTSINLDIDSKIQQKGEPGVSAEDVVTSNSGQASPHQQQHSRNTNIAPIARTGRVSAIATGKENAGGAGNQPAAHPSQTPRSHETAMRDASQIIAATIESGAIAAHARSLSAKNARNKHEQLPKMKITAGTNENSANVLPAISGETTPTGTTFNGPRNNIMGLGSPTTNNGTGSVISSPIHSKSPLSAILSPSRNVANNPSDAGTPVPSAKKPDPITIGASMRNKLAKITGIHSPFSDTANDSQPQISNTGPNTPPKSKDAGYFSPIETTPGDKNDAIPAKSPIQSQPVSQAQPQSPNIASSEPLSHRRTVVRSRHSNNLAQTSDVPSYDTVNPRSGSPNPDQSESLLSPVSTHPIHRTRISAGDRASIIPGQNNSEDSKRPQITRLKTVRNPAQTVASGETMFTPVHSHSNHPIHHIAIETDVSTPMRASLRSITMHPQKPNNGTDSQASPGKGTSGSTEGVTIAVPSGGGSDTPNTQQHTLSPTSISTPAQIAGIESYDGTPIHIRRGSIIRMLSITAEKASAETEGHLSSEKSATGSGVVRSNASSDTGSRETRPDNRDASINDQATTGLARRKTHLAAGHPRMVISGKTEEGASNLTHSRTKSTSTARLVVNGSEDGADHPELQKGPPSLALSQRRGSANTGALKLGTKLEHHASNHGSRFLDHEPEGLLSPPTDHRVISGAGGGITRRKSINSTHSGNEGNHISNMLSKNMGGSTLSLNQDVHALGASAGAASSATGNKRSERKEKTQSQMVDKMFSNPGRITPKQMNNMLKDTQSRHQQMIARLRDQAHGANPDGVTSSTTQIDGENDKTDPTKSDGSHPPNKLEVHMDSGAASGAHNGTGGSSGQDSSAFKYNGVKKRGQGKKSYISAAEHKKRKHCWLKLFRLFMIRRQLYLMYLSAMKFIPPVLAPSEVELILERIKNTEVNKNNMAITERLLALLRERDQSGGTSVLDNIDLIISAHLRSFSKFPLTQRRKFCELMEYEKHRPGKLIVMEGHFSNCFYFILSGKLEIFKGWDDAKYRLNVIGQGDSFGDRTMAILNDRRTASITTMENVELLCVDKREYHKFAKEEQKRLTSHLVQMSYFPLFLNKQDIVTRMSGCMQLLKYEPQQTIVREDTPNFQIIWILSGHCRCIKRVPFIKKRLQNNESNFILQPYTPGNPVEPGEEVVHELLAISEFSIGDSFPGLPNFPLPIDPNTRLPRFDRDHYIACLKDAPAVVSNVAIVANSIVEIMMISRVELCQIIDNEMIEYLLEDGNNIMNIPILKLQEAFLQRKQWDTYKKKIRSEVTSKKK